MPSLKEMSFWKPTERSTTLKSSKHPLDSSSSPRIIWSLKGKMFTVSARKSLRNSLKSQKSASWPNSRRIKLKFASRFWTIFSPSSSKALKLPSKWLNLSYPTMFTAKETGIYQWKGKPKISQQTLFRTMPSPIKWPTITLWEIF